MSQEKTMSQTVVSPSEETQRFLLVMLNIIMSMFAGTCIYCVYSDSGNSIQPVSLICGVIIAPLCVADIIYTSVRSKQINAKYGFALDNIFKGNNFGWHKKLDAVIILVLGAILIVCGMVAVFWTKKDKVAQQEAMINSTIMENRPSATLDIYCVNGRAYMKDGEGKVIGLEADKQPLECK